MARSEVLVDHPLQEDAFEPGADVRALGHGRNLAGVEVSQQVAPRSFRSSGCPSAGAAPPFWKNVSRSLPAALGWGAAIWNQRTGVDPALRHACSAPTLATP